VLIEKITVDYLTFTSIWTRKYRCCLIICSLQVRGADTIDFVSVVCHGFDWQMAVSYLLICLLRWFQMIFSYLLDASFMRHGSIVMFGFWKWQEDVESVVWVAFWRCKIWATASHSNSARLWCCNNQRCNIILVLFKVYLLYFTCKSYYLVARTTWNMERDGLFVKCIARFNFKCLYTVVATYCNYFVTCLHYCSNILRASSYIVGSTGTTLESIPIALQIIGTR